MSVEQGVVLRIRIITLRFGDQSEGSPPNKGSGERLDCFFRLGDVQPGPNGTGLYITQVLDCWIHQYNAYDLFVSNQMIGLMI